MSTLPQKIPDADIPFGTANADGTVTISMDWYLAMVAISQKVLGNGTTPTAELHYDFLNTADVENDALTALALSQKGSISTPSSVASGTGTIHFAASKRGMLMINGGTISAITFTRGSTVITLTNSVSIIPLSASDLLTITSSVAPTLYFVSL